MGLRIAKFDITEQIIRDALMMPEDSRIINIVRHEWHVSHNDAEMSKIGRGRIF